MHDEDNCVFIGENKTIDLTVKENKILKLLIQNKGKVVKYEQFCKLLYDDNIDYYFKNCISNKICRLRKKLKGEVEILTVTKIGYKIPANIYNYKKY